MTSRKQGLWEKVEQNARDERLESVLLSVAERFGRGRKERMAELGDFAALRKQMNRIKEEVLTNHEFFLDQVRAQVEARGGVVHLAADAAAARRIITRFALEHRVKTAVKAKSMTTEEVKLNAALLAAGIEVFETDLGEFIIQLGEEPPFHIVLPAIHQTREKIAALFAEKLGMTYDPSPPALTRKAREMLREKFLGAELGLTGANALVAENGTLVLLENEGNIRLTTTLPPLHVALVGIEKIIPRMTDLEILLKLLPRSATGQKMSAYLSLLPGPALADKGDGPTEFHLVFLDNGRSRLRHDPQLREALKCLRCGACLNVCPVFQHIGGHAYASVYPGPIGAMITQTLSAGDYGWQIPFLCSLCGACTEVCPAGIPIHHLLLELRRRANLKRQRPAAADQEKTPKPRITERILFGGWSFLATRPALYRAATKLAALAGNLFSSSDGFLRKLPPPAGRWTTTRDFPAPAEKPFRERWRKNEGRPAVDFLLPPHKREKMNLPPPPAVAEKSVAGHEPKKSPAAGDPEQLAREIQALSGEVFFGGSPAEAEASLQKILAGFSGKILVRWHHPDLEDLGLETIAERLGMRVESPGSPSGKSWREIAAEAALGVTAADYGLADSGTLVLLHGPGRDRMVSLLPPAHLAVLRRGRILSGLADLFLVLAGAMTDPAFPGLTMITGPSRTSDIELTPVVGVHGPGRLIVLLRE